MFRTIDLNTALQAALAGVASILGSYAVSGFAPEFVVAPVADMLTRVMPGAVLTFAITVLGDVGQSVNLLAAVGLAAAGLGLLAFLGIRLGRFLGSGPSVTLVAGGTITVAVALLTGSIGSGVGAGVAGAAVAGAGESWGIPVRTTRAARRRLLKSAGVFVVAGAVGTYFGSGRGGSDPVERPTGDRDGGADGDGDVTAPADVMDRTEVEEAVTERLRAAGEKSLDIAEIEPLVSNEFYEVDINSANPTPAVPNWELQITGVVETEQTFTFEDIAAMEPCHRFSTLRCVGEPLNGQKMDNALWTGVPVTSLLEQAEPEGAYVMLRAVDDYYNEFPLIALRDGFLAYGMNGDPLPRRHGYPVRALVPGHWGEVNVKWLEEIEVLDREAEGFWEKRGWQGTGPVNTVAKIHAVDRNVGDGLIQVSGHAYAGTRGVRGVEVSTDGGESWQEASLSEPLPGEDVWRQWTLEYELPGSEHEVVARVVEEGGNVQPNTEAPPYPSGPMGWVSKTVDG